MMKLDTTQTASPDGEYVAEKPIPPLEGLRQGLETQQRETQEGVQPSGSTHEFPHSVFPDSMIIYLTYLLGYLALASSLTATIYFPIIDLLTERYHTSVQAINLTITLYVVLQGIAPSFFSPLSDTLGRRPVFLITFAIYLLAGVGLVANTNNYVALILLRGLQSIGGSAVLSLAYAVVADIVPHSRRGSVLGPDAGRDKPWAVHRARGRRRSHPRKRKPEVVFCDARDIRCIRTPPHWVDDAGDWEIYTTGDIAAIPAVDDPNFGKTGRGKLSAPNPFPSVRLLFHRDTALILWLCATPYAVWYSIQTSIPLIYGPGYGFNDLEVGLAFLAGGGGVIAGGFIAGRLMDWSFRKTAIKAGFSPDKRKGIDIDSFPIEEARTTASIPIMFVSMFAVGGYGWAVHTRAHPAIPLILQFYIGAKCTILHQIYSALIVDIFPSSPGTAGASNNICRCTLSAIIVAILQPVVKAIGYSWLFTVLALVEGLSGMAAVWTLRRRGWEWRKKRSVQRGSAR
ncbi:hypothetical protein EKO27_g11421 [Xylaria grammica]|uniref:Major facilitator superfamily (MFS) profile domain-containing protein n=1 Tax=Xylaria grammica TaxID=363999 RepID=A0A439CNE2_9PEZI|nr:hypothetical protein EKO27_g11421 [Xylaria grammica]